MRHSSAYYGAVARSSKANAAPAFVTPMAAVSVTEPEGDEWLYELKLDGYRALLLKDGATVRLLSRNEKELTRMYPGIAAAGQKLPPERKAR
jgi:bifunctional non-homologous end joining protein LigD